MPVILKTTTGQMVKFKFYALVVPYLAVPMFIGGPMRGSDLKIVTCFGRDITFNTGDEEVGIPSLPS